MPIDKKLISRKITLINTDLKSLKALSKLSLKTYLSKTEYEALAERYLERIIGRSNGKFSWVKKSAGA